VYPAGLGSLRNIAECEEALGHFATARRAWLDLQRDLLSVRENKYEGWGEDAAQAAARLAPKVATLIIDAGAVTATGQGVPLQRVEVSINGEPLNPSLLHTPLERDPGRYLVRAGSGGSRPPAERAVELVSGEVETVDLRVVVDAPGGFAPAAADRRGAALRTAAWIGVGVGTASLAGAGIAALVRQSALDDLNQECGGSTTPCNPPAGNSADEQKKVRGVDERGHAAATWVNVLTVTGVVGLSAAAVTYVLSRSRSSQIALMVSPGTVSAVGEF
jgi:hypothetical protein